MSGFRVYQDLRITPGFAVNREQSRSLPISRLLRTNSPIGEWVGDVPSTSIHRLTYVYETSRLKTASCGSGQIRRSRRTIGPLVCQNEQNRHTFLRVIRHQDR